MNGKETVVRGFVAVDEGEFYFRCNRKDEVMIRDYQIGDLPERIRIGSELMQTCELDLSWGIASLSWERDMLATLWKQDLYWAEASRRIILND